MDGDHAAQGRFAVLKEDDLLVSQPAQGLE
jgi:hypothetical protein